MTAEQLAGLAGVIMSLVFAYVPGVSDWYNGLDKTQKASIMGVLLVAVAVGIFAASCGQLAEVGVTCDKTGALGLLQVLVAALVANQGTFVLLVKPYQK